ncbi:MAG: Mitochondrial inner membrane protein [Candidatus Tokpelaia hoelldobleri]|uniref:Mitochondrial inner membrane protein n=1 Tax=Candidatus Tokpelaia hoelldobleri TaxID=1902579 RepID=A0A1U9JWS8_9HYPH|nr:MAG: Mitochondrial inner membrane protein [Candidatus Tokpelaia hoelldoblerii]
MANTGKTRHSESTRSAASISHQITGEAEPVAIGNAAALTSSAMTTPENTPASNKASQTPPPPPEKPAKPQNHKPQEPNGRKPPQQPRRFALVLASLLAGLAGGTLAIGGITMLQKHDLMPNFITAYTGGEPLATSILPKTAAQDIAALKAQVGKQATDIENTLKALQTAPSGNADSKAALATLQQDISSRLGALETRLNALEQGQKNAVAPQQVQNLHTAVQSLQKQVSDVAATERKADIRMTALAAANALKAAVERGGSYSNELRLMEEVAPGGLSLEPLRAAADKGLPSTAELGTRFAKVADAIAATQTAIPDNAGFGQKLWAQARSLVVMRPTGNVTGNTAGAIAARMEVAINNGDYGRALNEWRGLSPQAQAVSRDFITTLESRTAIDKLLAQLVTTSLGHSKTQN